MTDKILKDTLTLPAAPWPPPAPDVFSVAVEETFFLLLGVLGTSPPPRLAGLWSLCWLLEVMVMSFVIALVLLSTYYWC